MNNFLEMKIMSCDNAERLQVMIEEVLRVM